MARRQDVRLRTQYLLTQILLAQRCGGQASPTIRVVSAPPTLVLDDRITAFGLLVEVHARLERAFGRVLEAECGISHGWFEALLRIARSPDHQLSMRQLSEQVVLTSGGITRLVDRLEGAGYVQRQAHPTDRRIQQVSLTRAGWRKLEQACAVHLRGLEEHFTGRLTVCELRGLTAALEKLRDPA